MHCLFIQLIFKSISRKLCGCHEKQHGDFLDFFVHNFDVLIVIVFFSFCYGTAPVVHPLPHGHQLVIHETSSHLNSRLHTLAGSSN